MDLKVIDSTIDRNPLRTAVRLAAMAGEPAPLFVPWGKVYRTRDGWFRFRCELKKRGRELMVAHLEMVAE